MRLIDADALNNSIEEEFDGVCTYDVSPSTAVSDFQAIVYAQPTIEADRGWCTGNPSEPSKYYVTLAIRHEGTDIRWTDLKKYGKNGWDMPEDGAIQVIAWMPAPEVYRG